MSEDRAPSETIQCKYCRQDVHSMSIAIHQVQCSRNEPCDKCGERIPARRMREHLDEDHGLVPCTLCKRLIEQRAMDIHVEQYCHKATERCSWCELELAREAMPEHREQCGSRTELCECGVRVLFKHLDLHRQSNHALSKPLGTGELEVPSHYSVEENLSEPEDTETSDDLYEILLAAGVPIEDITRSMKGFGEHRIEEVPPDDDEFTSHGDRRKARWETEDRSEMAEASTLFRDSAGVERLTDAFQNVLVGSDEVGITDAMIPCEFCNTPISMDGYILHASGCGRTKADDSTKVASLVQRSPCPLCNQNILTEDMPQHISTCQNMEEFELGGEHYRGAVGVGKSAIGSERDVWEDASAFDLVEEDDCRYCRESYPIQLLSEHQNVCEERKRLVNVSVPGRDEIGEGSSELPINFVSSSRNLDHYIFEESTHSNLSGIEEKYKSEQDSTMKRAEEEFSSDNKQRKESLPSSVRKALDELIAREKSRSTEARSSLTKGNTLADVDMNAFGQKRKLSKSPINERSCDLSMFVTKAEEVEVKKRKLRLVYENNVFGPKDSIVCEGLRELSPTLIRKIREQERRQQQYAAAQKEKESRGLSAILRNFSAERSVTESERFLKSCGVQIVRADEPLSNVKSLFLPPKKENVNEDKTTNINDPAAWKNNYPKLVDLTPKGSHKSD